MTRSSSVKCNEFFCVTAVAFSSLLVATSCAGKQTGDSGQDDTSMPSRVVDNTRTADAPEAAPPEPPEPSGGGSTAEGIAEPTPPGRAVEYDEQTSLGFSAEEAAERITRTFTEKATYADGSTTDLTIAIELTGEQVNGFARGVVSAIDISPDRSRPSEEALYLGARISLTTTDEAFREVLVGNVAVHKDQSVFVTLRVFASELAGKYEVSSAEQAPAPDGVAPEAFLEVEFSYQANQMAGGLIRSKSQDAAGDLKVADVATWGTPTISEPPSEPPAR